MEGDFFTANNYTNGVIAGLAFFTLFVVILVVIYAVIVIVARWKIFKKAGKKGWESIVPFYSDWVYVEISGLNWWWFFVVIAGNILTFSQTTSNGTTISFNFGSLISLFGTFVCNYNIAKKLHKETGFAVLMTIFPIILLPVIAFGSSYKFDHSVSLSMNGPFPDNGAGNASKSSSNMNAADDKADSNEDVKYCPYCGEKISKDVKYCPKCGKEV